MMGWTFFWPNHPFNARQLSTPREAEHIHFTSAVCLKAGTFRHEKHLFKSFLHQGENLIQFFHILPSECSKASLCKQIFLKHSKKADCHHKGEVKGWTKKGEKKKKSIYYHEKLFVINPNLGRQSINTSLKGEEQKGAKIPNHKKFMLFDLKGFSLSHILSWSNKCFLGIFLALCNLHICANSKYNATLHCSGKLKAC